MIVLTILGLAVAAALLALAVTLSHWRPTPRRAGFEVWYEHCPERSR